MKFSSLIKEQLTEMASMIRSVINETRMLQAWAGRTAWEADLKPPRIYAENNVLSFVEPVHMLTFWQDTEWRCSKGNSGYSCFHSCWVKDYHLLYLEEGYCILLLFFLPFCSNIKSQGDKCVVSVGYVAKAKS